MKKLFDTTSLACSKLVTRSYSTSFSLGIRLLHPSIQPAIYAIYGFVRYADEIVDTFHDYDKDELFAEFVTEYRKSLVRKISMNPILNAFQSIVNEYGLHELVDSFLNSMEMDLQKQNYSTQEEYKQYIYGSADVVGLMCLKVFVKGNQTQYETLKPYAMRLGSAFQKVNFLRDIKADYEQLNRSYFPNLATNELNENNKQHIITDISNDFSYALKGILLLPREAKFGVYIAYRYYLKLLKKLRTKPAKKILQERTRISDWLKFMILIKSYLRFKVNVL